MKNEDKTGVCDLCCRELPLADLNIGAYTARGEELVLCENCKKGNCILGA